MYNTLMAEREIISEGVRGRIRYFKSIIAPNPEQRRLLDGVREATNKAEDKILLDPHISPHDAVRELTRIKRTREQLKREIRKGKNPFVDK